MAWFDRMETKIPGHEHQWWRAEVTTSRSTSPAPPFSTDRQLLPDRI